MKFCKDCKWFELNTNFDYKDLQLKFAWCDNPHNLIYYTDLVSGKKSVKRSTECCKDQRNINWLGSVIVQVCGKTGRWFE